MEILPNDVLYVIFGKFNEISDTDSASTIVKDIYRLSRINKRFYNIIRKSNRIWTYLYRQNLSDNVPEDVEKEYIKIVKKFEELTNKFPYPEEYWSYERLH